jgi:fluoride exporter
MLSLLLVSLGCGLGALARHGVTTWLLTRGRAGAPWGIWVVNVLGSLVLGWFFARTGTGLLPHDGPLGHVWFTYGFLGGFTTFSSFAWQAVELTLAGRRREAAVSVLATVVVGLAAAWVGWVWGGGGA